MLLKLRPGTRRATADFTLKLNYELERNASCSSYLSTSPVNRSLRDGLSPYMVQYFPEAMWSRPIRFHPSFWRDMSLLSVRMAGIPGKPSMFFKGFIP